MTNESFPRFEVPELVMGAARILNRIIPQFEDREGEVSGFGLTYFEARRGETPIFADAFVGRDGLRSLYTADQLGGWASAKALTAAGVLRANSNLNTASSYDNQDSSIQIYQGGVGARMRDGGKCHGLAISAFKGPSDEAGSIIALRHAQLMNEEQAARIIERSANPAYDPLVERFESEIGARL